MAGIIHKIEEKLGMGGNKDGEHKGQSHDEHKKPDEHKKTDEHKEGIVDKIKDKIHGEGHSQDGHGEEKKKKKKEKKHHEDGHHSSSSDSDSD
ncbi:PREDICTED: dehydrin HIRD11-like [Tarenaya hassleriana]|uniref:dehydrin HIRD11-like n=1 Tax=Tarenaya hassleriana TaxID=28532 RepID=UPI00053C5223|nr:PREDICTED: dehydrin HIRD11-like [Tarenaya hassleriana]XP_010521310.1 PREDICTED: dehydrin HIRD11-like [Tarenaya hassleriana]XP_010528751.1 PREDICTED: dehydrin HIRD11-like [Tarenaya hassleriana]